MFQKRFLTLLLTSFVFLAAAITGFAQNAPVRGTVMLQKADGTKAPVAGAIVEAFRTDIGKGKMPEAKTNKRGEFSFVGFPFGQRFVLSVSGPGIAPGVYPDVKAGMETIEVIVTEGDGRKFTEAEARAAEKSAGPAPTGEMSAEEKKAQAELIKKNAEITEANKKAEDVNKVVNAALQAGGAAFKALNYDLAIAEFDKGIAADPDFAGSAPVFLNYKGVAHMKRALATYKAAGAGDAASKAAAMEKMKPDFASAFASYDRGLDLLKKAGPTDAEDQKIRDQTKIDLLSNLLEALGLSARFAGDPAKLAQANAVLEEYMAAEKDQVKKTASLLAYGNNMNGAGELKYAAVAYRKILESSPDNLDALIGLGLALYSEGSTASPPDKVVLQEGLNYMQRFVDAAPDSHQLKASTKTIIEELKNEQKLAPQKTTPPRKKG